METNGSPQQNTEAPKNSETPSAEKNSDLVARVRAFLEKPLNFGIVLAVLIVIIGLGYWMREDKDVRVGDKDTTPSAALTDQNSSTATSPTSTAGQPVVKVSTKTTALSALSASAAYIKARDSYQQSGFYLQFVNCDIVPPLISVVKKGTRVMLDNRDNTKRTIIFAGKTYYVSARGYVIATTDKVGDYDISCGGRRVTYIKVAL